MKTQQSTLRRMWLGKAAIAGFAVAALGAGSAAGGADDTAPPTRSIAYVLTTINWPIYQAKDASGKETKEECPNGINDGAREQFSASFPQKDGKKWTIAETTVMREAEIWWPTVEADKFPFREVGGKVAIGLNLDGKVKPSDFTSPDGKITGIDNQFYRAVGCILSYRDGSSQNLFENEHFEGKQFNRILFELTDVDSLLNDDDVTMTTYRGLDPLVRDAKGEFQADTTQRIDTQWGQDFIHKSKAKIVNGVLTTTEPSDFVWANEFVHQEASLDWMRDAHFELKLTPDTAEGMLGGYIDIETNYRSLNRRYGTHQISYGKTAAASLYKALRRLADAHPDSETGANTAISAALRITAVQVRLTHPKEKVAEMEIDKPARFAARGEDTKIQTR